MAKETGAEDRLSPLFGTKKRGERVTRDESVVDYEDLPDPVERGLEDLEQLEEAMDLIRGVVKRLQGLRKKQGEAGLCQQTAQAGIERADGE